MKNFDHLQVDGRLLETFLAVLEELSVSKAAARLDTNQSTVSHRLDRLRELVGDDLFVRSGRGIMPTPRAFEISHLARALLRQLSALASPPPFSVTDMDERIIIAATDFERGLFLIDVAKQMMKEAPKSRFDFVWDQYDSGDALRRGACDIATSPTILSNISGIHSKPLFTEQFRCYFDETCRSAPSDLDSYAQARHVRIIFSSTDTSFVDTAFELRGRRRIIATELPSLNELPSLLKGTDLVATLPARLSDRLMTGFAQCPVPFDVPLLHYSLFWHRRTDASPSHRWVRDRIIEAASVVA